MVERAAINQIGDVVIDAEVLYPEHEKMSAVSTESRAIGDFIDWLHQEGIHLSRYVTYEEYRDPHLATIEDSTTVLLARFFDIDLTVIEREKRAMLDRLRG